MTGESAECSSAASKADSSVEFASDGNRDWVRGQVGVRLYTVQVIYNLNWGDPERAPHTWCMPMMSVFGYNMYVYMCCTLCRKFLFDPLYTIMRYVIVCTGVHCTDEPQTG